MQKENPSDDEGLVNLAVNALEMLASIGGSVPNGAAAEEGEPELGRFLSSGEVPHAQACVLYVLRVGIIERLGEAGQVRACKRMQQRLCHCKVKRDGAILETRLCPGSLVQCLMPQTVAQSGLHPAVMLEHSKNVCAYKLVHRVD